MNAIPNFRGCLCIAAFTLLLLPPCPASAGSPGSLTLGQAVEEALARSPELRARRAEVSQAKARLRTAGTYPFDPEFAVELTRRSNGDSVTDREFRLGQEIEIGGQRRRRTAEADAELAASRAALLREERQLVARVQAAFVEALRVRELREVERSNTELARSLARVARKRLDFGAAAQMEVNLARVHVGRAERNLTLADGACTVARSVLAQVVGLDPSQPPEIEGDLDPPSDPPPDLAGLLAAAQERRADLSSFRSTAEATRARIELARRERIPNLELEALYGREDGSDRLLGGGVRLRIPLFNRNRGKIAEARAAHLEATANTTAKELRVRQEVAASHSRYRTYQTASLNLREQVLGTLEENLKLLQRSFEAGKTGWTEVLVFRREFVEVQREYIETVTEARLAGIELDLASGGPPTVTNEESQSW